MNPSPSFTVDSSIHRSIAPSPSLHTGSFSLRLIVIRLRRICQVKDNRRMRLSATTVGERAGEIDRTVESERAIGVDVDVKSFEVSRRVDETDVARLHKVVGHDNVLLVGGHFDVVRADGRLDLVGVIKPLDVVQVGDVERGDVISRRERDCEARKSERESWGL